MTVRILVGDVREQLRALPSESVHCCVTSPPYWGLRSYIADGDPLKPFEIGLEPDYPTYITHMVEVFREVRRVLRKDGTVWLNLGDSYATGAGKVGEHPGGGEQGAKWAGRAPRGATSKAGYRGGTSSKRPAMGKHEYLGDRIAIGPTSQPNRMPQPGLKPKDLVGIPWRVAFALQEDGWWLRQDIVWAKPNPMPESVHDRCTKAHEYIFLLAKDEQYFYDAAAIKEQVSGNAHSRGDGLNPKALGASQGIKQNSSFSAAVTDLVQERNKRSVWEVATQPFPEAHFACVDAETEALTPTGWRRHDELLDGNLIAAYDCNLNALAWQPASFHRYPFDGELVAIEKRDSSQRLTPNHRCLIRRRVGGVGVVEAAKLKPGMSVLTTAELWQDGGSGPSEDFAALLGWYLSEGERRRGRTIRINQSQSANPEHVETIRTLLRRLGSEFSERTRTREWRGRPSVEVTFGVRGAVAEELYAVSPDKTIDLEWVNWPRATIQVLLDAIIDGDGHRRPDGRACVVQKDRHFLDAFQMLALRLGWRTQVNVRRDGGHILYVTKGGWLTLRSTGGKHTPIGRRKYKGIVWCPTVDSTFWIARRNGKTFITGNTFPPALIEPCIKAATSEHGCCKHCGAGWERITGKVDTGRTQKMPDGMATYSGGHTAIHKDGREKGATDNPVMTTVTLGWYPSCACDKLPPLPAYPPLPSRAALNDERAYKAAMVAWRRACLPIDQERRGLCETAASIRVVPATVLDPFGGAGTTALVADRLQRDAVLIELSETYAAMARRRISGDAPLFSAVAAE